MGLCCVTVRQIQLQCYVTVPKVLINYGTSVRSIPASLKTTACLPACLPACLCRARCCCLLLLRTSREVTLVVAGYMPGGTNEALRHSIRKNEKSGLSYFCMRAGCPSTRGPSPPLLCNPCGIVAIMHPSGIVAIIVLFAIHACRCRTQQHQLGCMHFSHC